jgi:hypothetical protein
MNRFPKETMASYQATITIDGERFGVVSASVALETLKDHSQMPEMGSLKTTIQVSVDLRDAANLPPAMLLKLFDLANVVVAPKIKPIKVEFWKDSEHKELLCAYSFDGWISKFETAIPLSRESQALGVELPSGAGPGGLLILHLEPVMGQANFSEISLSC